MTRRPHPARICLAALLAVTPACTQRLIDPGFAEPVLEPVEPGSGKPYLLYRPARYDGSYHWPLVVVLHSAFPDNRHARLRAWTALAESHGFVVAAPEIQSAAIIWPANIPKRRKRLEEDLVHIARVVAHVRAGQNISEDRIFIYGFDRGAPAALRTGILNPDLFRAVGLCQPDFDSLLIADTVEQWDPHLPILVQYDVSDAIRGKPARRAADYLRQYGARIVEDPHGKQLAEDAAGCVNFFREILRTHDWFRIRAFTPHPDEPLAIQFKIRCTQPPTSARWDFGDGANATETQPKHVYKKPGTYRVTLQINDRHGNSHTRTRNLTVPMTHIAPPNVR